MIAAISNCSNLTPIRGSTTAAKKNAMVSGVLRRTSTYTVLKPRSAATGETRAAASKVPRINAKMPETTERKRVRRKPSQYRGRFSKMTSIRSFGCKRGRIKGGAAGAAEQPRRHGGRYLVTVDGREAGGGLNDRTRSGFPGLLVGAVFFEGFELVVDPVAELGVALLQADAVRLLGEGLVGSELEGVRLLVNEAGEDHVVSGHGFNLLVAQRLQAGGVGGGRDELGAVLVHDRGGRGGNGDGADLLALDVLGLLDGVVVLVHHEGLA